MGPKHGDCLQNQAGWRISEAGAAPAAANRDGEPETLERRQRSGQPFAVRWTQGNSGRQTVQLDGLVLLQAAVSDSGPQPLELIGGDHQSKLTRS